MLHIAPDVLKNTNDNKLIKLDLRHTATKHYTDVHRPTKNYLLYFHKIPTDPNTRHFSIS